MHKHKKSNKKSSLKHSDIINLISAIIGLMAMILGLIIKLLELGVIITPLPFNLCILYYKGWIKIKWKIKEVKK